MLAVGWCPPTAVDKLVRPRKAFGRVGFYVLPPLRWTTVSQDVGSDAWSVGVLSHVQGHGTVSAKRS
eukprot:936492-Prorocentrum_lima.AAC.1